MSLSGNWSNPSNGNNAVEWDTIDYDTDSIASLGPPAEFVIPAGLGGVWEFWFGGHLSSLGTTPYASIWRGGNDRFGIAPIVGGANDFTATGSTERAAGATVRANLSKSAGTQTLEGANGFFPAYFACAYRGTP